MDSSRIFISQFTIKILFVQFSTNGTYPKSLVIITLDGRKIYAKVGVFYYEIIEKTS